MARRVLLGVQHGVFELPVGRAFAKPNGHQAFEEFWLFKRFALNLAFASNHHSGARDPVQGNHVAREVRLVDGKNLINIQDIKWSKAIRASISLPFIFNPVILNDYVLVDVDFKAE